MMERRIKGNGKGRREKRGKSEVGGTEDVKRTVTFLGFKRDEYLSL